MDFGKDEVTVSSAITPPLYCFLLKVNAATGSEKKTKKNTTFATLVYSETHSKQTLSRAVRKTHLQGFIHGKSPHGKTRASLQHKPYKA